MSGFWDQKSEDEDFRDIPDEVNEQEAPPAQLPPRQGGKRKAAAPVQEVESEESDGGFDELEENDEDDYSAVLSDARLRLEQGRLYEMIMNHDLFADTNSDPAAAKSVQRQIRKFAKEQMEIMLGMRRETAKIESLEIDFPFNQVEVEVLKMLAKTASKGRSDDSDKFVPTVTRTTQEVEVIQSPRKEGLNRIAAPKAAPAPAKLAPKSTAKAPVKQAPVAQTKLPQKPAAPVQRKALTRTEAQILREEGVSPEDLHAVMDSEGLKKPIHKMNEDEIIEHNKKASARRQKRVKNPAALPMPSADQESMFQQTRLLESSSKMSGVNTIMSIINSQKK